MSAPQRWGDFGKALLHGVRESDAAWAASIYQQWTVGMLAPLHRGIPSPSAQGGQFESNSERASMRSQNELRLRALIRATRLLAAQDTEESQKRAKQLGSFLLSAWGLQSAARAAAPTDRELLGELREKWGDAQLPPKDAMVGGNDATTLIVNNLLARLT
jgi:hypothetical protein